MLVMSWKDSLDMRTVELFIVLLFRMVIVIVACQVMLMPKMRFTLRIRIRRYP